MRPAPTLLTITSPSTPFCRPVNPSTARSPPPHPASTPPLPPAARQEAHDTGVALVTACAQDLAECYVENLRLNGLTATLEPGA